MRKLTVRLRQSPDIVIVVGHLAQVDRRMYFEYDGDFLNRDLQLSPFKLPLRPGLIEHVDRAFGPLPGLFDDSLPDGWGLLLMDRIFRRAGRDPATVSPLERLAWLGTRTMGALTYHPAIDIERDDRLIDLHEIANNAGQIFSGDAVDVLPELVRAGGSPGGARPKILVGVKGDEIMSGEDDLPDGFAHWIVKFPAKADARDAGPIEFAYALMARAAGIDMPESKLFRSGKKTAYFGVRRFDRGVRNQRIHVHTFGNLIQVNFRIPSTDYADLLRATRALTRSHADVLRVFRQMVFNIAAHNRDDHAKNFAFLMNPTGEWTLSPGYDISLSAGPGGEHTMTVAGEGNAPGRQQALTLAKQSDIRPKEALAIFGEVNGAIRKWDQFADEAGLSKRITRSTSQRFQQI